MLAAAGDDTKTPALNTRERKKRPESFNSEKREMQKRLEDVQPALVPTNALVLAGALLCFLFYLYNGLINRSV